MLRGVFAALLKFGLAILSLLIIPSERPLN